MSINDYQSSFICTDIKIWKSILVILLFIIFIFLILVFNNNFYNYYSGTGIVKDNKLNILVNVKDLNKILKNEEMIIERTTFTYKVISLDENNLEYGTDIFKQIVIDIDLPLNMKIENNYINYKIITGKDTIINYLYKTIFKGE